jgi:hypothetical protein
VDHDRVHTVCADRYLPFIDRIPTLADSFQTPSAKLNVDDEFFRRW